MAEEYGIMVADRPSHSLYGYTFSIWCQADNRKVGTSEKRRGIFTRDLGYIMLV